ncbi:Peptidyl-tRNA hydrolase [hydrothermal vent metagenome]|uniref:peptidyl-tRNA hydrolase n=1 Tax=hydrothermal vent metagenome TaxID=652676 RepID=A0A3B1A8X7_9ZZZZ
MTAQIKLIVGLGNPGSDYDNTRHNAGFWLVDELTRQKSVHLKPELKFHGSSGKTQIVAQDVWLLKPSTYMNNSGQAVNSLARYYKIDVQQILVVHDELDLQPGTVRLKKGGGHGGHNGLRDIISHLSSKEFYRLRLGIGHPGNARDVSDYVLKTPSKSDKAQIEMCIDDSLREIQNIVSGKFAAVMNTLHTNKN